MWFPIAQIMLDLEATPFSIFIWRVQMQKPLIVSKKCLLKWAFLSGSYIYVQLFHCYDRAKE